MKSIKNFKIIGLTGQSGSGKSYVSKAFEKFGAKVINADSVAHLALKTERCKESLRNSFGDEIFDQNGDVVRKALAKAAFSSRENTLKLNSCTHPVIIELIEDDIAKAKSTPGCRGAVLDAPTLFESGLDSLCTVVISVIADESLRLQRIISRDGLTDEEAQLRLNAQRGDSFYTERADIVLKNNGTLEELTQKAEKTAKELFDE